MVLQGSGAISLADLQTEFGGTNPIGMDEYYAGGTNVDSTVSGVPTSGAIGLNTFYGKRKVYRFASSTNYYTVLSRYGSNFTIAQSGSDPDVQLQLASSANGSAVTQTYTTGRIQDYNTVTIDFEFYVSTGADALYFYMGLTAAPTNSYLEGTSSAGYQVVIEVYSGNGTFPRGFHLVRNGTGSPAASYNTTAHLGTGWHTMRIVYNKSATNTFQISYDGTVVITYNDANYASYVSGSGSYWGFGARTGGVTGDFYIRRVNVTATN